MLAEVQSKSCDDKLYKSLPLEPTVLVPPSPYTTIFLHVTHLLCPSFLVKGLNPRACARSDPIPEESVRILTCLRVELDSSEKK